MISGSGKQIDLTPFCFSKTNKFKKDWDFHLRPIIFNMSSCQIIRVSAWLNLNPHHSSARSDPTVWTPLSLPNSAVLLGGWGGSRAHLTAEIVPGVKPVIKELLTNASDQSRQAEEIFPWNTMELMHVGLITRQALSWQVELDTIMSQGGWNYEFKRI